jgi:SOS response regulatory protein OraA/RecX
MPRKKAHMNHLLRYQVNTRVNEKQYMALKDLLKNSCHDTMGDLIRSVLEDNEIRVKKVDQSSFEILKELASIKMELHAIGVNVNQITKAFHQSSTETQKIVESLKVTEKYKEVIPYVKNLERLISELTHRWSQK